VVTTPASEPVSRGHSAPPDDGHHKALSRGGRQRSRRLRCPRRRDPHPLRGERGRQEHPDARALRPVPPDEGEIQINGAKVAITSPADAIRRGIGMIHQHFMLVDTLSVAENVALGEKSQRGPLTDLGRVSARIRELADTYRLNVDPQAIIWQLSVGERQRVEIIKALYRNVSLLVLDEPTAVLTPREVDELSSCCGR